MSVTGQAADHGAAANGVSPIRSRVLVVQTELLPNLPLIASIARTGLEVVGPSCRASHALQCIEDAQPEAAVIDIALRDGVCFGLAEELLRRNIPFLFYMSWGDMDLIPDQLREMPLLEKPAHFALVAKLLLKVVKDRQPLAPHRQGDLDSPDW